MRPLPLILLLVLSASCASQPPVSSIAIGDTVTLRVGESATVEPRNVVLQFSEVISDSRCPTDVVCVWEGDAEASVRAVASDGSSSDLRLHTKSGSEPAAFAGLTVRLVSLEPKPREGTPPRQADYALTLEIGGH
ncbi:MAG TPA: hypothetical protein VFV54_11370 [Thermoanaerobaculia bacterium]|nr:hypothetical protein [Thermoanaerobaculia bacterium]